MSYTIRKVKDGYKVCKKSNLSKCFSKKPLSEETAKKQRIAINISELEGGLKPITARVGGKVLLKKKLVDKYFPKPDSYSTFVDAFVGGGSIFFYANKDNHKEVVNDIDPDIYELFKGFQKYSPNQLRDDLNGNYSKIDFKNIKDSKPSDAYHKFLKTYLLYKLSYFGRGVSFGKPRISSTFEGYQDRLRDATILNEDYKDVIKKYDSPSTFFYLDPPIRESSTKYNYSGIDIPELIKVLDSIKGKFLLSLGDVSIKKELFKKYKVITIPTKYVGVKTSGGQTKKVNEYIILNYEPRMKGGATHRMNILKKYDLEDNGHSLEELSKVSSVPIHILQEVYNRGIGAYKTNPSSVRLKNSYVKNVSAPMSKKLSKEQWAMARVYSFLDGNSKHDNDLRGGMKITDNSIIIPKKEFIKEHKELVGFFKEQAKDQGEELKKVLKGKGKVCSGCMGMCGGSMVKFHKQLAEVGLTHDKYMKQAKELAKASGYDPNKLSMSEDENHKLCYEGVCFGKVDYADYIIWSWLEHKKEVPEGTADKRRAAYRARATNIKGNWKNNKISPNNLAINILW